MKIDMKEDVIQCYASADPNTGSIQVFADKPKMMGATWVGSYLFTYTPTDNNDLLAGLRFEDGPKKIKMILKEA
jgi:hypothetical protein